MLFPFVTDPPPSDNDVVAGWGAFGVFALLILAVVLLGWSLARQFRKVNAAREAGVFGDEQTDREKRQVVIPIESDDTDQEKSED